MELQHISESLNLNIDFDEETGLPLFVEYRKILDLVLNYLPLPYSIAEHGCGKKTSIILNKLIDLGIPAFSLRRGMIMEKDMSEKALKEFEFNKRPHALVIHNPLYKTDINNEILQEMLREKGISVNPQNQEIIAGPYVLSHDERMQFKQARSHIFPIITFWNSVLNRQEELAIDPTVDPKGIFSIEEMRDLLRGPQALIFKAQILGDFVLDEHYLTTEHKEELYRLLGGKSLYSLNKYEYNDLIRKLNQSEEGSIGDPMHWTYANNIKVDDLERYKVLKGITGTGNKLSALFDRMLEAKKKGKLEKAKKLHDELERITNELKLADSVKDDAKWSEAMLEPLADVANIISYFNSFSTLHECIKNNESFTSNIDDYNYLNSLHGIGFQLRGRIETLGKISQNQDGEIDARALNFQFLVAATETIRQMNESGLKVFIDKVGNIHGLLIDEDTSDAIFKDPAILPNITKSAICHCSHIDTVKDAGKFDGRLGVLSGIELAQLFNDLQRYHRISTKYPNIQNAMMVTAFIGEEMNFTGEGVSMPGSSAVCGKADPEQIYNMKNLEGEMFRERFIEFLEYLRDQQAARHISLMNNFWESYDEKLIDQCFEPTHFFTTHSYERHIEQGPLLDRHQLPLVLVETIMGIFQKDFYFTGINAEKASLAFNKSLREEVLNDEFKGTRITVGITEPLVKTLQFEEVDYGLRLHLHGEKNHAGATAIEDRKDPGVACSRLVDKFFEIVNSIEKEEGVSLEPLLGEIDFIPRTNRNVIPSVASVSIGLKADDLGTDIKTKITEQLEDFVVKTLSKPVEEGGEAVIAFYYDEISSVNVAHCVRSSIDLRGSTVEKMLRFREKIDDILEHIIAQYDVEIEGQVEQELDPYPLSHSGQVLQIERSYGGSHNPNEAELSRDLLRGTLIQLGVTWDYLHLTSLDRFNLYNLTKEQLPESWKNAYHSFVSGALHDTCNIARKTLDIKEEVTEG